MALPFSRTISSAYDLYAKQGIADHIESGFVEEYHLRNDIRSNTLEFVIDGNTEHAIVPRRIALKLALQISGDGGGEAANKTTIAAGNSVVAPINNIFHSIFENVNVYLSNQPTTKIDNNYPYIAYIQTLMQYGEEPLNTNFSLTGWFKDTAGKMDDPDGENDGFEKRCQLWRDRPTKTVEYIGRLHSPIFMQDKILPTQVSMTVRLQKKANKDFYLSYYSGGKYEISITAASLLVQKVALTPIYKESIRRMLNEGNSIPYPLVIPCINYMTIEPNSTQFIRDNLFLGKTPDRIIIGLVETKAYQGDSEKNPFNFQHFNLSQIALYKDGMPFPRPITRLDYTNKNYAEAYHNLMVSVHGNDSRFVPYITYKDFGSGYALYCYDMSPDQLGSTTHGAASNSVSNIRLELKFSTPTPQNITLLAYCERRHLLEIHEDRRVSIDL